ncbi:MAG: HEPN domain-containing protein [Lachnospiraceae bacterium]|nr:HEPN domain-containing protein [Lachnospiraceae bacterium]
MAEPTLLSIAKADLLTAGNLVNSENKYIKHQAAYFTQQAIEKTIKYLIQLKTGKFPWGHDIDKLVRLAKQNDIFVPEEIDKHKMVYTEWESVARYYPQKIIRRDTICRAINETKRWHMELRNKGIK